MNAQLNRDIIGAYVDVCRELSQEEFCARSGHPFLLHSAETGALVPTDQTRGVTVDRLVLSDDPTKRGSENHGKEAAYSVFALYPRTGDCEKISVGCSSGCDVQINDESVSAEHAAFLVDSAGYKVHDQNSAAGTQVNSESVEPDRPVPVASGDRISLGYVDLTFLGPAEFYQFVRRWFEV